VSSVPWLPNPGLNEGFYGKIRGKSAINGIFHGKITGHPRKKKCRFIAGNIIYNGGFSRKPWS
jgi:truncated hemoglobin YjbI